MGSRSGSFTVRTLLGVGALAAAAFVPTVFCPTRAEAISAFSREYKTECTTCHTIFPHLNEFGQAFEKNAFVWPGAVPMSKKVKVSQTEEERKSSEFIKLSGIPAVLPFSAVLATSYIFDDTKEDEFDQKNLRAVLLAGGAFGRDMIGFWFNQSLGGFSTSPTAPGYWFAVRDPLGIPAHIRAGKFSPDLNLRSTLLVRPAVSAAGYTVDTFSWTGAQAGLEINAFLGPRVQVVLGVNDRNNAPASTATKSVNPHSVNDFYGRISTKIGGADYHGKEPDIDLDKDSVWDYLSVSVGAFGYFGSTSTGDGVDHDLSRYGVQAEASYKRAILMLGATFGENNADAADPLKSTALSVGFDYFLDAKFAIGLRYDVLDVDGKDRRNVFIPAIVYAPLQSFKFQVSAAVDSNPAGADAGKADANTTATLSATLSF